MKETVTVRKAIENRKVSLEQLISRKRIALSEAPPGRLRVSHRGEKSSYYHCDSTENKNGIYIPKSNLGFASALAQKQYDERIIEAAAQEMKALQGYLRNIPAMAVESIYDSLPASRQKLVIPINEPDEAYRARWLSQPLPYQSTRMAAPALVTETGMLLDSKAEYVISTQLDKRNIAFIPQFPVYLEGNKIIYIDFKVLNLRTRSEFYWEHLGMLDSEEYRSKSLPRLNELIMNGYIPGKNLILSWESKESRMDLRVIDRLIEEYLI